eukprot:TRINITY_DN17543_c0_g1_i1.p1 TRINITY_DN17543_c0_g1~~TRINITY_DN17543_c0_g1_i1.p1  ORF type:complete len:601 (-),score=138.53 TRINITY_DN17543_c0_g1_i1:73-1875(-)
MVKSGSLEPNAPLLPSSTPPSPTLVSFVACNINGDSPSLSPMIERCIDASQPLPLSFSDPLSISSPSCESLKSEETFPLLNPKPTVVVKPSVCIGTARLFAILFIGCIGGAYGIEDAVGNVGPLIAIASIVILPWVLQYPMCMLTAELSSSLPSNSGLIQWTNCAFGKYARFFTSQSIVLSMVVSVTDNAVYPALLVSYLVEIVKIEPVWQAAIKAAVVVFSVVLNIIGVDIVGGCALLMTAVVVSPFIVMVAFGAPQIDPSTWIVVPTFHEMNWAVFLPLIFWNLNGVDGAGNISEEVENPKKAFPRAMILLTLATSLVYLAPVLVGLSVDSNWQAWSDGYFVTIASHIGPDWVRASLPWMMLVGGMISSVGFLVTLLCTSSRLIHGVAQLNIVPALCKPFTRLHRRFKTPDTCILLNGAVILIMALFLDFDELVAVDCVFYALRLIIEIASLLMLRYRYPDLPRPIKIGLGMKGLIAFCTFPLVFSAVTMVVGCTVSLKSGVLAVGLMIASLLIGLLFQFVYKKELPKLPEIEQHEAEIHKLREVVISVTPQQPADASKPEQQIEQQAPLSEDLAPPPTSPSPTQSPPPTGEGMVPLV